MNHEYIIAHADKSVLKISGLEVKGLNTRQLEEILAEKLHTFVRVIGVTGDNIEMDVYNIDPEQVRRNEKGLIESIVLTEGKYHQVRRMMASRGMTVRYLIRVAEGQITLEGLARGTCRELSDAEVAQLRDSAECTTLFAENFGSQQA